MWLQKGESGSNKQMTNYKHYIQSEMWDVLNAAETFHAGHIFLHFLAQLFLYGPKITNTWATVVVCVHTFTLADTLTDASCQSAIQAWHHVAGSSVWKHILMLELRVDVHTSVIQVFGFFRGKPLIALRKRTPVSGFGHHVFYHIVSFISASCSHSYQLPESWECNLFCP